MKRPLLVDTQWLHDNLDNPEIEIIENAWVADSGWRVAETGASGLKQIGGPCCWQRHYSRPFFTMYYRLHQRQEVKWHERV